MGWPESIVAMGIVALVAGIWRSLNGRIEILDSEKVNAAHCRSMLDERARAMQEVKDILTEQAKALGKMSAHLANIDGWLSAYGFPGPKRNPGDPSDPLEV